MEQTNRNIFFRKLRDWNRELYNKHIPTPAYLDLEEFFPEHKILEENWRIIRDEIDLVIKNSKNIPTFHDIDDGQEYISDNDGVAWNIFSLKLYGMWHTKNAKHCPETVRILKKLKYVKTANFSILDPGKHIPPHFGPYKGILRYQLALRVPKEGSCQLFVDHKPYSWKEGEGVLFDDTYLHEVRNETKEKRIALLLDVRRRRMGFFLGIYDKFIYKIIQLVLILNGSFKKSDVNF